MRTTHLRKPALLVMAMLWLASASAEELASPILSEELAKQDSIYQGKGEQRVEGYTVDRSLVTYADGLSSDFDSTLAKLGPDERWLDIGAGKGNAILDYYAPTYSVTHTKVQQPGSWKARAVAMSIEDRRTPLWEKTAASLGGQQIRYLFGKKLGDYSLEELGKFHVITDVMGGFSYTENLSRFMERVLGLLELNGSFFTVLQDVQWEDGANQPYYAGSSFLTELKDADGSELKVCSWLKRISCVQVTCESKPDWQPPTEAFRVRKVCDDVSVPALTTVHYAAGTPPERRFQVVRKFEAASAKTTPAPAR